MNKKRQAIIAALLVAVLVAVPVFANVTGLADVSEVLAADDAEEKLPDYFLDLSEGLKADTDYDGISVGADMPVVSGKDPVSFTLNEEDYTSLYTVQGGDPKATPNDGAIPTEGTYVKVEPKRDGTFTIVTNYIGSSSAKKIWFVRNNAGVGETVESFDTDTEKADVKSYEVKEGETYYFYAKGSNVMIAGLGIEYEAEKNNVPDYFIDLSEGLKAGEDYNGISVGADMEDKNKEPVVFTLDGEKYTSLYTVQGGDPKATPNDGAIPTEGTYVKVEPKRDGTFTIVTNYIGSSSAKKIWFVRNNAGVGETVESFDTDTEKADVKSYEVKAGETYYFYAKGSNVMIAGLGIKYEEVKNNVPDYFTDLSGGLKAGEDYNGISVGADMEDKNKEPVVFTLDGEKYTSLYTVQGGDPKATPNDGAIPTEGTYVKVEPKKDGTFTIVTNYIGSSSAKKIWFVRNNAGVGETVESFDTDTEKADVKSYEVKAGETYYFYAKGSNVMIAGLGIKYDGTEDPDDDETFVAVTGITGVAIEMTAGETITLSGTVAPENATNKDIVWSVKDAGTTGATIADGKLTATSAGMVVVTATIENGLTATTPYTQDFTITVKAADALELGDVDGSGTVDAGDALAILKNIVKLKLDKFIAELADVDQNGKINADDALAILKSLVNIEE